MRNWYELESKSFAANGNVQVSMRTAPPGRRIRRIVLCLEGVFTQNGAAVLIAGSKLCELFSTVIVGDKIRGTGRFFNFLNWIMRGRETDRPASLPATNDGVFRRHVRLVIPFEDNLSFSPDDALPTTDMFMDKPVIVDFSSLATLGATLSALTGTLRTFLVLDDPDPGVAPSISELGYRDYSGQTLELEPGLYSHLFAFRETGGTIDSAEVATLKLTADGSTVYDLLKPYELANDFDRVYGAGSDFGADSATAPVAAEQIVDEPAATAAAAATVETDFLPLFFGGPGCKASDLLRIEKVGRIDFTGTDSAIRLGYRRFQPRTVEQAVKAMLKNGVPTPDPARIVVKTASKMPLSGTKGWLGRFLPARQQ